METLQDSLLDENPLLALAANDTDQIAQTNTTRTRQEYQIEEPEIDPDRENICDVCGDIFTYREFNKHKKTEKHKLAKQNQKRIRKRLESLERRTPKIASASAPIPYQSVPITHDEEPKFLKERYYLRQGVELPEQQQQYLNILTTFLALRFSLNNQSGEEIKFSMNNKQWGIFGDVVIEVVDESDTEVHAIQCKQTQIRKEISVSALGAGSGKFSIKEVSEVLRRLRKRNNYDKTFFKLFTLSSIEVKDELRFIYDAATVDAWKKKEGGNEDWKGREVIVAQYKKKILIDTTDDPDNIYIFKIIRGNDELMDKDLNKFSLFTNQKKASSLQHHIRTMIEDKFDLKKDLSNDIIRFVSDSFKSNIIYSYNYILTNRDILLKIAELILTPYMLFPESTVESRTIHTWDETISKFDVIVIKNHYDMIHKIFSSINIVLNRKIGRHVDTSVRHLTIEKEAIKDKSLKSEIFDGYPSSTRKVSLAYLYITLWKIEAAPLLLRVDNETNLQLILKIITFLKNENITCKFILATSFKIHRSSFPDHLNTFINLTDLGKTDDLFLGEILLRLKIPVLDFSVSLKEIVELNQDFLKKVTADALLNMSLEDYSLKNIFVPMTDDIIDNTLVFSDDTIEKVKDFFRRTGDVEVINNLSYVINVDGSPTRVEVPPDI